MIDSHVHLDDGRFDSDREAVIERARAAGVDEFVVPATTRAGWERIAALADRFDGLHPAYGLHPWFMRQHGADDLEALDRWLDEHAAVALGECGLDYHSSVADHHAQRQVFRAQLVLAGNHRLPVIVHARKALDQVLAELRRHPGLSGVLHSFSGSLQQAQQAVALGFRLGIAATVGYERAQKLRRVVREIDETALLIETDAPDQSGPGHRGERNEPAFLPEHLETMAALRQQPVAALARRLDENCRNLFKLEKKDDD
jgi:TatD DNase family protein